MTASEESSPNQDVRMRGFAERTSVASAIAWLDEQSQVLEAELVDVSEASGRRLTADVAAEIDVPSFQRAAMDGYALSGDETTGAGSYNVLTFRVVGESLPGFGFDGTVESGQAVRIMTGAPVPQGADAIVPAEYASESAGTVEITTSVPPKKHVAQPGEDVRCGSQIVSAGRRLRPQDLGLLASVGVEQVPVVRRPRVRLLATGNEIVPPGAPRKPYQIFDANSSMLGALILRDGGLIESSQRLPDEPQGLRVAMTAQGADVVLVTGGSSVGQEDHAPTVLATEGELSIHGIAMRPSSPTGMGLIGNSLVFLLPGNPVSCLCAYDFFAGRAIRALGGRSPNWPYPLEQKTVGRKIVSAVGRVDYVRVRIIDGQVEPIAVSGASILSTTTRADGFVIVPAASEGLGPGALVDVYCYDVGE